MVKEAELHQERSRWLKRNDMGGGGLPEQALDRPRAGVFLHPARSITPTTNHRLYLNVAQEACSTPGIKLPPKMSLFDPSTARISWLRRTQVKRSTYIRPRSFTITHQPYLKAECTSTVQKPGKIYHPGIPKRCKLMTASLYY